MDTVNQPHRLSEPGQHGLREAVLISGDLLNALLHARQLYLLPWRDNDGEAHQLVITAFPVAEPRPIPANYGTCKATLIIPPALRHMFEAPP